MNKLLKAKSDTTADDHIHAHVRSIVLEKLMVFALSDCHVINISLSDRHNGMEVCLFVKIFRTSMYHIESF